MSISGSMLVASGAMAAYSNSMAVTGDNIANLNTVGYKESRYGFADLMSTLDGSSRPATGSGWRMSTSLFNRAPWNRHRTPPTWRFPAMVFLSCAIH